MYLDNYLNDYYDYLPISGARIEGLGLTYNAGMSVVVTINGSAELPANTEIIQQVSFDNQETWETLECCGASVMGWFDTELTGNQTIYTRTILKTLDINIIPKLHDITINIEQIVTLYTMAKKVLTDFGLMPEQYWIDPELFEFPIPYGWLDSKSHREEMRIIAEACIGQVHQDRQGIIRVEGSTYLDNYAINPQLAISRSEYKTKKNPSSPIYNYIEVYTQPLKPVAVTENIYSGQEETISAGETKTLEVFYTKKPCIEADATLSGAPVGCVISSETYYAFGATIKVYSSTNAGTFTLNITGKPLEVQGSKKIVAFDDKSILDNGKLVYTFPNNPLIQTEEVAQKVANILLAIGTRNKKDLNLEWRGNPALELGDKITVESKNGSEIDYHVTRNDMTWNGVFKQTTDGKRA